MDSASRSTPELHRATQAARMLPVEAGQGIYLIATCLLNARTSQMSIAEMYEWLAQKYPEYQYTKRKIRQVLKHDSERKCPRFVIANTCRLAGVPLRWTIRPGTEAQLRQCFSGPPPTQRPLPQFYGGLSHVIHCVLCNRGFDRHKSFVRHQRKAHSSNATISPAVHKEMRPINASALICTTGTGSKRAASKAYPTDKLTDPEPAAEAGAETEFATQEEIAMGEETLFVDEVPTAAKAGERRRYREFEFDELASANESATGDETISDDQVFEDAASHKSLDDDPYDVDRILGEKQEDGRMASIADGTASQATRITDRTRSLFRTILAENGIANADDAMLEQEIVIIFKLTRLHRIKLGRLGDFADCPVIIDDELSDIVTKTVAPPLLQSPPSPSSTSPYSPLSSSLSSPSSSPPSSTPSRMLLRDAFDNVRSYAGRHASKNGPNKRKRKRTSCRPWYEDAGSRAPHTLL